MMAVTLILMMIESILYTGIRAPDLYCTLIHCIYDEHRRKVLGRGPLYALARMPSNSRVNSSMASRVSIKCPYASFSSRAIAKD